MFGERTTPEHARLLDTAEELIREEGADGWTLADLARRADVGESELESEFGTQWQVFSLVIRRDERRFEETILEELPESPGQKVLAVLEACVPEYDWTYWIELWSLALRDERARELRAELDGRFRDLIEGMVREGVEAGEFSVSDTRAAAITIATLIDALAMQATLGDTTVRPNYMLDACVTVCGTLLGASLELPPLE
ncbi:MAG: TetR family transcriptional regulator, partial [Actinomycetota bacterium]|nr:TetR family transcriptional regulator [Actinomycetota bacterium]